jgi:hypothetical protein
MLLCTLIITNYDALFTGVVTLTTRYAQPFNALLFCVFAGWLMHRNHQLQENKQGFHQAEHTIFKQTAMLALFLTNPRRSTRQETGTSSMDIEEVSAAMVIRIKNRILSRVQRTAILRVCRLADASQPSITRDQARISSG